MDSCKPGCLENNGTNLRLLYIDNIEIMGGSVHIIKKNTETLVLASKENGLDVNADETKYMVMPRQQGAGRRHITKTDNISFERLGHFKYLGTTLKYQNSTQEEIKSRLKSGNACYHLVHKLLSSNLLSKNVIQNYKLNSFVVCVRNLVAHIEEGM